MTPWTAAMILVPQYLVTASAFWLIWWGARSHDALVFKVIALVLAIVPAIVMPTLTVIAQTSHMPVADITALFAVSSSSVGALRALFLVLWAILSKDNAALRIGGAVLAALLFLCFAMAGIALAVSASGS